MNTIMLQDGRCTHTFPHPTPILQHQRDEVLGNGVGLSPFLLSLCELDEL